MKIHEIITETTAGATSSGSIANTSTPILVNKNKKYVGTMTKPATKSPPQPKIAKQTPSDNGLDSDNLFGTLIKR